MLFLGTLALQAFKFHIRSQDTQGQPHRKTTQTEKPPSSHCSLPRPGAKFVYGKTLRWIQLSPDIRHWESWVRLTPPLNMASQQIISKRVIVFQGHSIINQNNVQPLVQDFAFEISSHILYPIIKSLQFLENPNLLKWLIYSGPSPDWIPPSHSWIRTAFPRPLLAFHCQV